MQKCALIIIWGIRRRCSSQLRTTESEQRVSAQRIDKNKCICKWNTERCGDFRTRSSLMLALKMGRKIMTAKRSLFRGDESKCRQGSRVRIATLAFQLLTRALRCLLGYQTALSLQDSHAILTKTSWLC